MVATGLAISNQIQMDLSARVTLKLDRWPRKIIGHFSCHYKFCASFRSHLGIQTGVTVRKHSNRLCDLEIWWMTSKNNRAPILYQFKLSASLRSHLWIQIGITVQERSIRRFFDSCDVEIWRMTLKNNRTPLICHFKLCALCRSHLRNQTGVTLQNKTLNWGQNCTFFAPCDLEIWRMTSKKKS